MSEQTLHLRINEVILKINMDFDKYYQYLKTYFSKILLPVDKDRNIDIEINIKWSDESLNRRINKGKNKDRWVQIGGSTLKGEGRIVAMRKIQRKLKVIYDVAEKDQCLQVNLIMQRKPLPYFFRYGPLSKPNDEWFFALTYYFLYYPLFWYLQQKKKTFVLHASALEVKDKGIVICGLEGIGKTSLALMFLEEQDSVFLSDNLVFFDAKNVYPCYELLRLHQDPDQPDLDKNFDKINKFSIIKDFYQPKFEPAGNGIIPKIIIFPEFSKDFFVKKLSVDEAVNRAITLSYLASELNNYLEYGNLLDVLCLGKDCRKSAVSTMSETFRAAISSAGCYEVGMPKKNGLKKNFERLKEAVLKE